MLRPEGHITIGADGSGTNNFVGYLHSVSISPTSMSDEDIKQMYNQTKQSVLPSLGDDDFEETDPNSRFVLSPAMKPVFDKPVPSRSITAAICSLFARTSADGKTWENMSGSPVEVKSAKIKIGAYQTTYSQNYSWVRLKDYLIYSH